MQIPNQQIISEFPQIKLHHNAWKSILMQILNKQAIPKFPRAKVSYDPQENIWTLQEKYSYRDEIKKSTIILDKGFEFDLSSIPRLFWIVIGTHELSLEAPLIHDFMYMSRGGTREYFQQKPILGSIKTKGVYYSRKEVDDLFLRMMQQAGVSRWRRLLGYIGVKFCGGWYWNSNEKKFEENPALKS
ncbi:DUF1353 domain-containing protein [Mastigocoleus testarum]|nr:DUF1353 domain-containing protein [Mastigocoleus testarum]